jgi:hypothetical protein
MCAAALAFDLGAELFEAIHAARCQNDARSCLG